MLLPNHSLTDTKAYDKDLGSVVAGKQLIEWCYCADHVTDRCQDVVQDLPHCSNDIVTEVSVSTTSAENVIVAEGNHCCYGI